MQTGVKIVNNPCDAGSNLTFIGYPEAQGAAGVIGFEIEPHLVTGANHKIWRGRTRQAGEGTDM